MIDPLLRAVADDRARNPLLAARLIGVLPKRPSIMLLGAQGWPLLCWLAPRIARAQVWRIVDDDEDAIDDALEEIAGWAFDRRLTVTWPKRAMLVHLPGGAWRIEGVLGDAARPSGLREVDGVVCEGLLASLPPALLEAFATMLRRPLLATLNQVGPAVLRPAAPALRLRRPGDARAGAVAVARFAGLLRARGDQVWVAAAAWRARGDALALQRGWIDEAVLDAQAAAPRAGVRIAEWAERRRRQMMQGRLEIRRPYRDLLALPG